MESTLLANKDVDVTFAQEKGQFIMGCLGQEIARELALRVSTLA
jgi:hypothetical protein